MHSSMDLVLIYYFFKLNGVTGTTVTLSGSKSYAELGQTNYRLTCTVTNDDNPSLGTVAFSRGEVQISAYIPTCTIGASDPGYTQTCGQNGQFYLDITSVGLRDDAAWRCSRRSQYSDLFTLPVYYGPNNDMTLTPSSPQIVMASSALTVDCSVTCKPCSYTWTKGSQTLSTTARIQLTNINKDQAGDYICTATNTMTGSTPRLSTLSVTVQYPPEVTLDTLPGSSTCRPYRVYVGQQNIQLLCQVIDAVPGVTSFTWTHERSVITSATSSVYNLSPVTRSSGGNYTCAGRNSVGISSSSSSIQVEVHYAPVVSVESSRSRVVITGQTLTLTCSVDSKPPASVTWTRKDGGSFIPQTGSTLTIPNIQRSQTGTYVCTATNTLSPCTGAAPPSTPVVEEVNIYVQYKPTISGFDSSYPVTESSHLLINCSKYTTPGNPSLTNYMWTGPGSYTSSTPVLSISNITRSHTGQYTCTATNTLTPTGEPPHTGSATGHFEVDVQYSATINSLTINSAHGSVTVDEDDTMTLKCLVDSNPNSTIRLVNGSQEVTKAENSLMASYSSVAECRHRGDYFCTARNNIGVAGSSSVKLSVKCRPRLDESFKHSSVYTSGLGANATLSVVVLGYPTPTFTWNTKSSTSRNLTGIIVAVSDISVNISLNLLHILNDDFGDYILTVENGVGNPRSFTFSVEPEGPPTTPTNLTIVADGPNSILVSWKQQHNGGSQQMFIIEYSQDKLTWQTGGTVSEGEDVEYLQYTIPSLQPSTSYHVRVVARNRFGDSRYTKTVDATTKDATVLVSSAPHVNAGVIAGATVGGVVILLAIVASVICIVRKGFPCRHCPPVNEMAKTRTTAQQRVSSDNTTYINPVAAAQGPYSDLNRAGDETQTYTELKTYENIDSHQHQDSLQMTHEDQQENSASHYVSLENEYYQNEQISNTVSPYESIDADV